MVSWGIVAVGAVVLLVGGLADQLGLDGDEGANEFGSKQLLAVIAGAVLIAVGLAVQFVKPGTSAPTD